MLLALGAAAFLAAPTSVPYRWKSVQMVGAGFVSGVVFSPAARGVAYARTDIGGAYRWDAGAGRWAPMLDWVGDEDLNLMGVESIAADPHDPKGVVLACGTYTGATTPDGAILRSKDGGRTFSVARVPVKFGGNENGRGNGERLSFDPNDSRHLLLGTRNDGLWESRDVAATWTRVSEFPATGGAGGAGIVATLFDPAGGAGGKGSARAYVAASDRSGPTLYEGGDGVWMPVPGAPTGLFPTHLALGGDGSLWMTTSSDPGPGAATAGAVWRLKEGKWADVTPERGPFGYVGVSVQADRPQVAVVSSFCRPGGEQIFRTTDGGASWRPVIGGKETFDDARTPYVARTGIHWPFDVEIDPFDPDHALFTTGYGGQETFDLRDADRGRPVRWRPMATGIEESVALDLLSPTKGSWLVSGIGDYGGFVHRDLDRPAPEGNFAGPHFGNTTGVAAGDLNPDVIVRVGRSSGAGREANLGFTLDGGRHWRPVPSTPPNAREGRIAVSADGRVWVWSLKDGAYRSEDYGLEWSRCEAGGEPLAGGLRVVADRISPNRFYALDLFGDRLYVSQDGARTFAARDLRLPGGPPKPGDRGDARGGQDALYATPGRSGDLWIAAFDGLYHAAPARSFERVSGPSEIQAFGFGRSAPKAETPALYLAGVVDGVRGIFRSDDAAGSWVRINDDAHQWGLVLAITGDPKRYGRVYVGTHGRGVIYGKPG